MFYLGCHSRPCHPVCLMGIWVALTRSPDLHALTLKGLSSDSVFIDLYALTFCGTSGIGHWRTTLLWLICLTHKQVHQNRRKGHELDKKLLGPPETNAGFVSFVVGD